MLFSQRLQNGFQTNNKIVDLLKKLDPIIIAFDEKKYKPGFFWKIPEQVKVTDDIVYRCAIRIPKPILPSLSLKE